MTVIVWAVLLLLIGEACAYKDVDFLAFLTRMAGGFAAGCGVVAQGVLWGLTLHHERTSG